MIKFTVEDRDGRQQSLEIPEGINLSLMEALKASGYEILATCGGMALCATCHVRVLEGIEKLPEPSEQELSMLETLPNAEEDSRLSCQLYINENMNGMLIKVLGDLQ